MSLHGIDRLLADVQYGRFERPLSGLTAASALVTGAEISGHCAQSLHVDPACAVPDVRHLEYFHDHARVDRLLFDGSLDATRGVLRPGLSRPGLGLEPKRADANASLRQG